MKNKICTVSLIAIMTVGLSTVSSDARVTTKNSNRSYADAYNQVNAMRYQQEYADATAVTATTASATATLPVMVNDEKLANEILNGTASDTNVSTLEACSMIYPNGVFRWGVPESGVRKSPTNQCIAVVTLVDATTNAVLATTTVAAGDSIKCNIDSFPESGMNPIALNNTELPADLAPTMADVEAVMNEEQKQNAGVKIAAGAIIGGLAGNLLAPKEAGAKQGKIPLGTGKTQLIDSAIGAVSGAGLMAASSYSGKVAGDTIKSTAVNAASGMVVGNMLAGTSGGEDFIATTKCKIPNTTDERDCVPGRINKIESSDSYKVTTDEFLIVHSKTGTLKECAKSTTPNSQEYKCTNVSGYVKIQVQVDGKNKNLGEVTDSERTNGHVDNRYVPNEDNNEIFTKLDGSEIKDDMYYQVSSASKTTGSAIRAYAVLAEGTKLKSKAKDLPENVTYYERNSDGSLGQEIPAKDKDGKQVIVFTPTTNDASDGGLIDMSNQGRVKGTAVGAGVGGAMGGFAGYQGAKTEVEERWTSAIREYNDSLSGFACMTGTRYLSKYNDDVTIPTLTLSE